MAQTDIHTPKGFRDILPELAQKRRKTINTIVSILEEHDFVPIETPTVEFAETLTGKYGEEERLIYKFTDRGERKLALRFDLTVPLARYVATNNPPLPFRRYQIGQVFRGENPQRGRWREFTQLDFDTVGLEKGINDASIQEDALVIATAVKATRSIGLKNAQMAINDRRHFSNIPIEVIRAFDKLNKIGIEGVEKEITSQGFNKNQFEDFKFLIIEGKKRVGDLNKLFSVLSGKYGLTEGKDYFFDPTLARGLDYYTFTIFELKPDNDPKSLSIGAGGRYDNLIGVFSKKNIPAVGFSFGLDRICKIVN